MTDEHEKLTAEYERLVKAVCQADDAPDDISAGAALKLSVASCRHILARLGPPTAEDAADIGIAEDRA